jgi:hypothetical protein
MLTQEICILNSMEDQNMILNGILLLFMVQTQEANKKPFLAEL